ncbi:hypothetical protein CF336_g9242, partial [Tilletia laevis]
MADNTSTIQLRLTPVSVPFDPETFAIRPTEKVRIDLVGASTSVTPPRPDNGVFPCAALDRHPAHIISNGSYFTLKTSVLESNSIKVDGCLLHDHTHTLRNGEIIEFGRATFVRLDEAYDEDGDYECWPLYSFVPAISMKVRLTFPPHFDSRRVWTDPFGPPVSYTPPSSIKPSTALSLTFSKRHPVPTPARVLDHVPRMTAPSSSPPQAFKAPQLASVPVLDPAAPHGTNWAGVAHLLEELRAVAPSPRSSSSSPRLSPSSYVTPLIADAYYPPTSVSPPVPLARRTFCYGDFVSTGGGALPAELPGARSSKHETVATSLKSEPDAPPDAFPTACPPEAHTSPRTSTPHCGSAVGPPDDDYRSGHPASAFRSAHLAVSRVWIAWRHARRQIHNSAVTSVEIALERVRAALQQTRSAPRPSAIESVPLATSGPDHTT